MHGAAPQSSTRYALTIILIPGYRYIHIVDRREVIETTCQTTFYECYEMRLINTATFELEEVWDDSVVDYAILSHRWRDQEISYTDIWDVTRNSNNLKNA